jgi:hypothetical protein
MNRQLTIFGGIAAAAGVAYFLDSTRGRRRRALARDKAFSVSSRFGDMLRKGGRDLGNRAAGTLASTRSLMHTRNYSL